MEGKAAEVADVLAALANARRLQILCVLIETGECSVGALVRHVGISQSALSQHLARMRDEGLIGSVAKARRSGTASSIRESRR